MQSLTKHLDHRDTVSEAVSICMQDCVRLCDALKCVSKAIFAIVVHVVRVRRSADIICCLDRSVATVSACLNTSEILTKAR